MKRCERSCFLGFLFFPRFQSDESRELVSTEGCTPTAYPQGLVRLKCLKVTVALFSHGTGSTILAERLGPSTPSSPTSTPNSPTVLCSGVSDPILSTCGSGPLCSSISGKCGEIPLFSVSLHSLVVVSRNGFKNTVSNGGSCQLPWGGRVSLCRVYFQSDLRGSC